MKRSVHGAGAPELRRAGMVVQEAQRQREPARIGAFEAGAADHHVDAVVEHVGPDAVPQEFDRALVAVGLQHAGAAEFEKAQARMPLDEGPDLVLARGVEAEGTTRHLLPQQPVGADDRRFRLAEGLALHGMVDDEEMVADGVVIVDVATREQAGAVRDRRHLP